MSQLVRFGVSVEKTLLEKFDRLIKEKNYVNRSEALRDLIRRELVEKHWQGTDEIAGALTIIYNHHKRELLNKIIEVQHEFQKVIISTTHIHLDHDNCMEIIAVKGNPSRVKKLSESLTSIKGVKHGVLSIAGTGSDLK
ncbi:MAG: nickel-responsive regulator [Candidatus Fischerbacteria bacterium RBG_13_37_8]|uniref:Putative nickel-responsive regulator n=1 Tax=Candidatus Fischerbacteria bacterium RBG_13_37_8 TaxID=1817863 RepID=A0A1F5VXU8_9BACT|nr:MAG: nickel-responsive regulator [Candidatus Fischerbacteria bacterium RBG_13_37_8]